MQRPRSQGRAEVHLQYSPQIIREKGYQGKEREGESKIQGDCELFSRVGLWEGSLSVMIPRDPYLGPVLRGGLCCPS